MKIVAVGPLWRGSNAGGLFRALSRCGCLIEIIDEFYYISLRAKNKASKIGAKLLRNLQTVDFNNAILESVEKFRPDFLLVYKGAFVTPETLKKSAELGCKLVLFYPDVSMTAHGGNIPRCIPLYDLAFTTKTFGVRDMLEKFNFSNAIFLPHGFDPEIHRVLPIAQKDLALYGCDASFIGTWSPKKDRYLTTLKKEIPHLNLKIWGEQWFRSNSDIIRSSIMGKPVLGDLYALSIQCSAINIGLLSEQVSGASSGDLITSRTFHIPGASGFLLHEQNEESIQYFKDGEEAAFFNSESDL